MTQALASVRWPQVPVTATVLVPVGSTEQHGPHLPVATDTVIAAAVADAVAPLVAERTGVEVLVAPALSYGASGEHQGFPGTISIGHDALRVVLIELVRSLSTWARRIVLVNAHGGNAPTLATVVDQLRHEQHDVVAVACAVETPSDAHAGHDETSVMLHLRPDLVDLARAVPGNTAPLTELLPELMAVGMRPVTPTGILGDPTDATAQAGRILFDGIVARVAQEVAHG